MFGWLFKPTCPCDPCAKQWIEGQLKWLSEEFGLHLLLERPVLLPTREYFPDVYDGTPDTAEILFRRVCGYMGVNPDDVELEFFHDDTPAWSGSSGYAAGTWYQRNDIYDTGVVRIERGGLDSLDVLIGIMAHELAHQRLLGETRIFGEEYDNELLTDLTAVYHGFGVFLANNPRRSTGELGRWPGSKLYMPTYLSEPMVGYALAHLAWFRDEDKPAWVKELRYVPRGVFQQGHRYLRETRDSLFVPARFS